MDDVFKDAMKQVFREAPPELAEGFRQKLVFIQGQNRHCTTTVQSCLDGMADPPSLLELLTAAYVVNGGLLFKHCEEEEADGTTAAATGDEEEEYAQLLREMDELHCGGGPTSTHPAPPRPTPTATTGDSSAKAGESSSPR
jgi:hypothetical protein